MSTDEFLKEQFLSLRTEIDDSTTRIFWLLIGGMFLVMVSGYLASAYPATPANVAIPFFLLAIMVAFINEQNNINRAGKYIREVVEPTVPDVTGWENWLASDSRYREADRAYFIGFSVFFMICFATSATMTLVQLEKQMSINYVYFWCTAAAYGLSALCVVTVLIRHFRTSTIL